MIADALSALRPGAQWSMTGETLAGLVWHDQSSQPPTQEEVSAWIAANQVRQHHVNAERDRRLMSFPFSGKTFDFCDNRGSDINIAGAGTLALAAIITGAQPGNLRWADANVDFTWVAADNSSVTMDAQTCLNFAKQAADWKARHIRKARALKDMSPIPADYASDSRWTS
jgi:hypothetical protein